MDGAVGGGGVGLGDGAVERVASEGAVGEAGAAGGDGLQELAVRGEYVQGAGADVGDEVAAVGGECHAVSATAFVRHVAKRLAGSDRAVRSNGVAVELAAAGIDDQGVLGGSEGQAVGEGEAGVDAL